MLGGGGGAPVEVLGQELTLRLPGKTEDNGRMRWTWILSWQMTMDKINAFTINTFTLPSFAAPNSPSATSCVESLTCVLHVSP